MPVSVDARSPMESGDDYIPEDDEGGSDDDGFFDEQGGLEEVGEFFSEARLEQLVGTNDVESVTFLEVRINTEEIMMRDLGMRLPNLSELKLNNSNVPSMRDLGTSFKNLTVIWLARSNVQELDGIGGLVAIKEIYLAFNEVKDLSAMVGCDTLEVLDLEGNAVGDPAEVHFLVSCENLTVLTLEGNPIANAEDYREDVLKNLPQIEVLDDIDRDDSHGADAGAAGSLVSGGTDFALNISVEVDDPELHAANGVTDDDVRPRTASHLSPSKKTEKDVDELMLVHQGIKHARTGFDDVDFVSLQDCEEQVEDLRPGSAMHKTGSRPGSASFRPGSGLGSAGESRGMSPAGSIESAESGDGRVAYRPGSSGSGGQRRPGTSSSGGSRRPSTASMSVAHAGVGIGGGGGTRPGTSCRPGTSSMRPRTAVLGFGQRHGTSGPPRPGTATGSRPSTAGGDHAWAFRRSARSSKGGGGDEDQGVDVASDLTYGADEVYCGNLARGLRRRNVSQAAEKYIGKEDVFTELSCDEILTELRRSPPIPVCIASSCGLVCVPFACSCLPSDVTVVVRRWKSETVTLALTPDEAAPLMDYKVEILSEICSFECVLFVDE